jgi:hypothetical protein
MFPPTVFLQHNSHSAEFVKTPEGKQTAWENKQSTKLWANQSGNSEVSKSALFCPRMELVEHLFQK